MADFDFLVIGAGSAGCVVASKLASIGSVGLIEAGDHQAYGMVRRPSDYVKRFGSQDDWALETVPQAGLSGRRVRFPRGRGLGGSTRINASIWLRPLDECLQKISEYSGGHICKDSLSKAVETVERLVQPEAPRWTSETTLAFLASAHSLGHHAELYLRMNRRGVRRTAADVFLNSTCGDRERVTLLCDCLVDRLQLYGTRAEGIIVRIDGTERLITAGRGVVVCGGAIASPAILQRSGIGDKSLLDELGIDCRIDCPAVGKQLRDHLIFPVMFSTRATRPFPDHWEVRDLARWQTMGTGPVASNLAEAGMFVGEGQDRIQIHVTPTDYLRHPSLSSGATITLGVTGSHPQSVGSVCIAGKDPGQPPKIDPAYLSDPADLTSLTNGIRLAREIAGGYPLAELVSDERVPGKIALEKSVRRFSQTLYHPVGGCVIGQVVSNRFAVIGADRLWVADASVLADMPAANPNPLVTALAWWMAERLCESIDVRDSI